MSRPVFRSLGFVALAAGSIILQVAAPGAAVAGTTVGDAAAFIVSQQRDDGGFGAGEAGYAGFETPDALLAIGAAAQADGSWSTGEALAAVQAVVRNGKTGLAYLDDFADGAYGPLSAGNAARLVIVAVALGLDPAGFDPDGDGAANLVSTMQSGLLPDGSFGAGVMNTTLTAMVAYHAAGLGVPAGSVAYVEGAQQANGSWDYAGDASGDEADPDTTGLALVALVASGRGNGDASVEAGLAFLAASQNDDGTWSEAFGGESNPSSTALAVLGIRALGFDAGSSCWRDVAEPGALGTGYASPLAALAALQQDDGHLASPFDQWGLNTLGTSQGVQALASGFLPQVVASPLECPAPVTTTTAAQTTTTTAATTTTSQPVSTTSDPPNTAASTSTSSTVLASASSTSTTRPWWASGATLPRTGGESRSRAALGAMLVGMGSAALALSALVARRRPGSRGVRR